MVWGTTPHTFVPAKHRSPVIVTGVGPAGREIVYNNPPPPSQGHDPNINPALYTLGHDRDDPTHTPPPRTSTHSQRTTSRVFTPLFAQPGVSSQCSRSTTPAPLPPSRREATPSLPQSKFAATMAKAKENVKIQPPKRPLEDLLSESIS